MVCSRSKRRSKQKEEEEAAEECSTKCACQEMQELRERFRLNKRKCPSALACSNSIHCATKHNVVQRMCSNQVGLLTVKRVVWPEQRCVVILNAVNPQVSHCSTN
jgi:hypothetical protein